MTKVSYKITKNGKIVGSKSYTSWQEVKAVVEYLGPGFSFTTVYTYFDPYDTANTREAHRKHALKVQEKLALTRG